MQQHAEVLERPLARQDFHAFVDHAHHAADLVGALVEVVDLGLCHLGGEAREAGEDEHQMALERGKARRRQEDRLHVNAAIALECNAVEATVRGRDLVLRADALADHILLDVDGERA